MAQHEDYRMEGKQTSTDLIAVLSERFDWSVDHQDSLDALGGKGAWLE